MKMKISKECKEQIKKLLEEFFECNIDEKDTETFISCIQHCIYHKEFKAFDHLVYKQIWKKLPFDTEKMSFPELYNNLDKLTKLLRKYSSKEKVKKLYNKITTIIAYHNKDYDYLANKITNLLSSL